VVPGCGRGVPSILQKHRQEGRVTPELKILERLIRDGDKAFADPDTARALCLQKASFKDPLIAFACSAILLHDGDWQGARECVRMNRELDLERVKKLIAWGDKIARNKTTANEALNVP
jgi:hypothetical protein